MRKILLLLTILFLIQTGYAVEGDSLWSHIYGIPGAQQQATTVIQTSDGNYLIAGWIWADWPVSYDMYLIKTNTVGDTIWTKTYAELGMEQAYSVIQTDDEGFLLVGYTRLSDNEGYMVKTDSLGNVLWTKIYGGWFEPSNEGFNSVLQTPDGGYILAGTTAYGSPKMWLVRTDSFGDSLWTRRYGGNTEEVAVRLMATSDGGYALAGWTNSFGAGARDGWLLKTNASGDSLWSQTYGGTNTEYVYDAIKTSDDGFLLAGRTSSYGAGLADAWVVKTDSLGAVEFTTTYGGPYDEEARTVIETSDGNYLLAGKTATYVYGTIDAWVVKFNTVGDTLWTRHFGGSEADIANSIIQLDDGNYLMAGSYRTAVPFADFAWLFCLEGMVTGVSPVKLSPPNQFTLDAAHPNPFNPSTALSYELRAASQVKLYVYDTSGKLVAELVNGWKPAGTHSATFDGTELASGIYLARLEAGGFTAAQKLVLLK